MTKKMERKINRAAKNRAHRKTETLTIERAIFKGTLQEGYDD